MLTFIDRHADQIHDDFPWFGTLHRILSSWPNIVPPAIVTGIGPAGREITYNNPPPPSQECDLSGPLPYTDRPEITATGRRGLTQIITGCTAAHQGESEERVWSGP